MHPLEVVGRLTFSSLFIASGLMKLQSYEFETGGELMDNVAPKLDTAIETLTEHIPSLPFSYSDARAIQLRSHVPKLMQPFYSQILLAGLCLEIVGGLLFLFGSVLGAYALILFTAVVTFVMHDYWNEQDEYIQQADTVHFWKNITMVGALLTFISQKAQIRNSKAKID